MLQEEVKRHRKRRLKILASLGSLSINTIRNIRMFEADVTDKFRILGFVGEVLYRLILETEILV